MFRLIILIESWVKLRGKCCCFDHYRFPGGYGEGDQFVGVRVPHLRKTARLYYRQMTLEEAEQLLQDSDNRIFYHPARSLHR